MSDLERLLLVVGIALAVAIVVVLTRYRPLVRSRALAETELAPGTYLLTSEGCSTCERARASLRRRSVEFEELSWQLRPEVFDRLGIDAVPSVLAVETGGAGRWWRGGVPRRLKR